MTERRVDVLVFSGCPHADAALTRVREAVTDAGLPAAVRVVHVESDEEARRLRFLGSPTVHVNGVDVDPTAASRHDFGLRCRLYEVDARLDGAPPVAWIVAALRGRAVGTDERA